eukprot:8337723-Pyramimonas_sp.AAC.1
MVQSPSDKRVASPAQNRLSRQPIAPEGRPRVQGVTLLSGDPALLRVELKEPVESEQPDSCEELIVDKETLYMMKSKANGAVQKLVSSAVEPQSCAHAVPTLDHMHLVDRLFPSNTSAITAHE